MNNFTYSWSRKHTGTAIGGVLHTYRASGDTPRSSLVGFLLFLCLCTQLLSGLFAMSRAVEAVEIRGFACTLHQTIPYIFVALLLWHVVRALSTSTSVGIAALKSGAGVLLCVFITLGTGYMMASSGEAAYWGAVISVFNFIDVAATVSGFLLYLAGFVAGYELMVDISTLSASICGVTTSSTAVFVFFILVVHVLAGVSLFWSTVAHMGVAHENSTVGGFSLRGASKASLFATVESRDWRYSLFVLVLAITTFSGGVWLLRGSNGALLNTETKPPAGVATEAYFSGIYACFRYVDLTSCAVGLAAVACVGWLFLTRPTSAIIRSAVLLFIGIYAGLFTFCGFLSTDLVERSVVNLPSRPLKPVLDRQADSWSGALCSSKPFQQERDLAVVAKDADRFVNEEFKNPMIYGQYREITRLMGFDKRYPCMVGGSLNRRTADPLSLMRLDRHYGVNYNTWTAQRMEVCARMSMRKDITLRNVADGWEAKSTRPTTNN